MRLDFSKMNPRLGQKGVVIYIKILMDMDIMRPCLCAEALRHTTTMEKMCRCQCFEAARRKHLLRGSTSGDGTIQQQKLIQWVRKFDINILKFLNHPYDDDRVVRKSLEWEVEHVLKRLEPGYDISQEYWNDSLYDPIYWSLTNSGMPARRGPGEA